MKVLKILGSLLIAAIIFSGCETKNSEEKADTTSTVDKETTKEFDFKNQAVGYNIYDTTWQDETYTYTGEDMQIKFEIASMPVQTEFSFLIYIDGVLTPYYSNIDAVLSDRQIFKTQEGEQKTDFAIYFQPLYGEYGKTYNLTVVLLDNPNYMLEDTSFVSFGFNHSIMEVSKKKLKYQADTKENVDVSSICEVRDLADEVENKFVNDYAEGGNNLNEIVYCAFNTTSLYNNNKDEKNPGYLSVNKNDKLKLYIPFLGKDGEYRVSLYVNYKLMPVFDGKNYLDVKIQRNKYTEKLVEVDLSEYSGLNHIELIIVDKNGTQVLKEGPVLLEIRE